MGRQQKLFKLKSLVLIITFLLFLNNNSYCTYQVGPSLFLFEGGYSFSIIKNNAIISHFFTHDIDENIYKGYFLGLNYYYIIPHSNYRFFINLSYHNIQKENSKNIKMEYWKILPGDITGKTGIVSSSETSYLQLSVNVSRNIFYKRLYLSLGFGINLNYSIKNQIKFRLIEKDDSFSDVIPELTIIDEKNAIYKQLLNSYLDVNYSINTGIIYESVVINISDNFDIFLFPFINFQYSINKTESLIPKTRNISIGIKIGLLFSSKNSESPLCW